MPTGYKRYLKRELHDVVRLLCLFGLLLTVAVLAIYFRATGHILVAVAVTFALVAGAGGVPWYVIRLLVTVVRMSKFKMTLKVPEQQIDKCFIGEGERILSALQSQKKDSNERIFGEFKLPQYKGYHRWQLSREERQKLRPGLRERRIISVGHTLEEARRKLPSGSDSIWEKVWVSGGTDAEERDPAQKQ